MAGINKPNDFLALKIFWNSSPSYLGVMVCSLEKTNGSRMQRWEKQFMFNHLIISEGELSVSRKTSGMAEGCQLMYILRWGQSKLNVFI